VSMKVTAAFPGNNSNSSNNSANLKHNAVGVSLGRKRKLLNSFNNNVAVVDDEKNFELLPGIPKGNGAFDLNRCDGRTNHLPFILMSQGVQPIANLLRVNEGDGSISR
jgi:hypothetical protein